MVLNFFLNLNLNLKKALAIFFLFILVNYNLNAQGVKPFLEISGKALNNKGKQVNPLQISVFENGFELYKFESKSGIKLTFESNRYYTVMIKARDFQSSTLVIDSNVPKKKEKENFRFEFEYQLTESGDTSKIESSELPAAIIKFNKVKKGFSISDKYNSFRKEMNEK